jgi:hypothetical protein
MLHAIGSRLTYANVMATFAVFLGLAGGAYALTGIPDRGGVYHGCVDGNTSVLRVVKTATSCRKAKTVRRGKRRVRIPGESAIAWSQQGPRGIAGQKGVNATTNLIVRTKSSTFSFGGQDAACNPGERAVGGGIGRTDGSDTSGDVVMASFPAHLNAAGTMTVPAEAGSTPDRWHGAYSVSTVAPNITTWAVCASP